MKKIVLAAIMLISLSAFSQEGKTQFIIETSYGNMEGILYDDTPLHRDNFIKLVSDGWYDSSEFHRVINQFMIQGGGHYDGRRDPGYKIDAEILPNHFHKKGALAAARMGDNVNPQKQSSGSQFYIVQGRTFTEQDLTMMEKRYEHAAYNEAYQKLLELPENSKIKEELIKHQNSGDIEAIQNLIGRLTPQADSMVALTEHFTYSSEQKKIYQTIGGTPHLDNEYTVFGEITKGLEVIDKIAAVKTDSSDKPVEAVRMVIRIKK